MTVPQHKNPSKDRTGKAPYNFVPLPEAIVAAEECPVRDRYDTDRVTGVIRCTLLTKTPLYTRAALERHEVGHIKSKDKHQFFYVDPVTMEPVIPGSSLRGAIRALVEIAAYSKIQPVTDRQLFFRSLDTSTAGKAYGGRMTGGDRKGKGSHPNVSAGYMERHGHTFCIRPAQTLKGTQYYRVEEEVVMRAIPGLRSMTQWNTAKKRYLPNRDYRWLRSEVWFIPVSCTSHKPESSQFYANVTEISMTPPEDSTGWSKGVLVASGWVPSRGRGKHLHWIIGPPVENNDELIEIDSLDVEAYEEDGAGISKTIKDKGWSVLPKSGDVRIPCFYIRWEDSQGRQRIAFGHTAMFRLPYEKSPRDLLPDYLKDDDVTDIAEAIFGWVDDKKGRTIAGRVYFCDAQVQSAENGLWVLADGQESVRSLLSGPKPTSFQQYLTQRTDEKDNLHTYDGGGEKTLRGHKLYWHKSSDLTPHNYESRGTVDSQVTRYRPVKEGVTFAFDIRFENLTKAELGVVLWVLQQCSLENQHMKLGMAKPLGLGTVQITPTLYLSKRVQRYTELLSEWAPALHEATGPDDIRPFTCAFEEFVWNALPVEARGTARSYRSLPRIQALQIMLRWPGPKGTDYMTFPNGFKERTVLPGPLDHWSDNEPQEKSQPLAKPQDQGKSKSNLIDGILGKLNLP